MNVLRSPVGGLSLAAAVVLISIGCGSDDPIGSTSTVLPSTAPASSVEGNDGDKGRLPDRDPDVTGVVGAGVGDAQPTGFLTQPSDPDYDGMGLGATGSDPLVVGPDGTMMSVADLDSASAPVCNLIDGSRNRFRSV